MRAAVFALTCLTSLTVLMGAELFTQEEPFRGLGSGINASEPYCGHLAIVIDDTKAWAATTLKDTLFAINTRKGLTGTQWEMKATVVCNIVAAAADENGFNDYGGTTWSTTDATRAMTKGEAVAANQSGLIEIGLHGYRAAISDPMANGNPYRVIAPWVTGAYADSTTEGVVKDGWAYLVDSVGIPQEDVNFFACNGHRLDAIHMFYLGQYFKYGRSGTIWSTGYGQFPDDNATSQSNNRDRGGLLEFNRTNLDPIMYWWYGWDSSMQRAWQPFTPPMRLMMPHIAPPANSNAALNIADTIEIAYRLAMARGKGILVWHDQNLALPGTPSGSTLGEWNGMHTLFEGLADVILAGIANEGPKLKVCKATELGNAASAVSYIDGVVNLNDNLKLEPDTSSAAAGSYYSIPWGFPHGLASAWADSGWSYIDRDSTALSGGPFGYFNDTGVFLSDESAGTDTKGLILFFACPPNSRVRATVYGSINYVPEASLTDSLSAGWLDVRVTPVRFSLDPTDTTSITSFIQGGAAATLEASSDPGARSTSDWSGPGTSDNTIAYDLTRTQGRFHRTDGTTLYRTTGWSGTLWYQNGVAVTEDLSQRWRPFHGDGYVPADCQYVKVTIQPMGFQTTLSDTTMIACPVIQAYPR